MENKYFTPEISDIRIGYECEILTSASTEYGEHVPESERWMKIKLGLSTVKMGDNFVKDVFFYQHSSETIRVPFLTKEQLEAEGWIEEGKMHGNLLMDYKNSNSLYITFGYGEFIYKNNDIFPYIRIFDSWDSHKTLNMMYTGICPSINEFRQIMKLLNVS